MRNQDKSYLVISEGADGEKNTAPARVFHSSNIEGCGKYWANS
jgi:hypothetical protein